MNADPARKFDQLISVFMCTAHVHNYAVQIIGYDFKRV